jgi:hypothetical protein
LGIRAGLLLGEQLSLVCLPGLTATLDRCEIQRSGCDVGGDASQCDQLTAEHAKEQPGSDPPFPVAQKLSVLA